MDPQLIQKSIQNEELALSSYQKFNHYSVVGFAFIAPLGLIVILITGALNGHENRDIENELWFIVISCLIGFFLYRIQRRRLKFKSIQTDAKRGALIQAVTKCSKEMGWKVVKNKGDVVILKTQPGFFSGSWGERITIIFKGKRVLLNSICDLDKRPSIVSMGRNRENVTSLTNHIQNVN